MSQGKRNKSQEDTVDLYGKKRKLDCNRNENGVMNNEEIERLVQEAAFDYARKLEVPGTIARIHLKNFMCHSNLEVDFNRKINFIVGRNGSGKSAILTGIILALGCNASTTNRASSIKDFVKKGATSATVEITLNNQGTRAYKQAEYGNAIIITRVISAVSGQSTYKIRSARGELKSSKKEELDNIISHLNIQVNNPVCVLNQDTARTFLSNSDPGEKYKLFKKATQLQIIEDTYQNTLKNLDEAKRVYMQKKKAAEALSAEIKDLKKRQKFYNTMEDLEKKVQSLENEYYWAKAIRDENLYNQLQKDLETEVGKCPNFKEEIENFRSSIEELVDKNRSLASQLNVLEQEEAEILGKLNAAKEKEKMQNHGTSQIFKLYKQKESIKKRLEVDINTLQQEIMKISNMHGTNYAEEKQKLAEKIQKLEQDSEQIDARIKTSDFDYHQLRSAIASYVSDQKSLQSEEREVSQLIEMKKRQIKTFEREDRGEITVYGSWMQNLLANIDELHRNRKFERKPLGPIGAFIKLKDPTWAPAIESFLSPRFLSSFCVHSSNDARVLNSLFDRMRIERSPNLLIGKFFDKVHNVGPNRVIAPGYSSLLDALIISDPVVANCVIDQFSAESILLIPTSDEAHQLMSQRERVPPKCQRAITKKGDLYFPDPNYKSYAGSGSERAKLLQVSRSDAIRNFKEELAVLENKVKDIQLQTQSMNQKIQQEQHQLQNINTVRNSLSKEKLNISKELSKLKNSVEPESSSLATLLEELEEIKKRCNNVEAEGKKLKEEFEKSQLEVQESKSELNVLQKENQKIISAVTSLKEKINANESQIQMVNMKLKTIQKSYDTHLAKIKHMETDLKTREEKYKETLDTATKFGKRIETRRPANIIVDEITNLKECVKNFQQREKCTKEEITRTLDEKLIRYTEIDVNMSKMDRAFKRLPDIVATRNEFLQWLRRFVIIRVQCFFYGILMTRKYSGRIEIDDIAGKMFVNAAPTSSGNTDQLLEKGVKSLSGGERSFSTVSLILALWGVAEPPFYFLDEFDVFMDKVNRQIVMDLLLYYASSNGFQYVFLTPQDTSSVKSGKEVTIHWLEAPKRGNLAVTG